jgi:hypothetical protein
MSTKRERILAAIKTKLDTVTGIGTPARSTRSNPYATQRGESPAINLLFLSDNAETNNPVGFINWTLIFRVEVFTRGDGPDTLADPIIQSINTKIMADQSLGGLSMDIEPSSVSFELLDGDKAVGVLFLNYEVMYRTSATDLSV